MAIRRRPSTREHCRYHGKWGTSTEIPMAKPVEEEIQIPKAVKSKTPAVFAAVSVTVPNTGRSQMRSYFTNH